MSNFSLEKLGQGGLDIHAGGSDLKFPHHENEIAQSEAYCNCQQWVNYWLHVGHLNIKGFKMSKSLKNFITIRQALEVHSPRQVRFCFLLHKYNSPMDYGDGTMAQAVNIDRIISEFFHNVKAVVRRLGIKEPQYIASKETSIQLFLENIKSSVIESLADDFDTPKAISFLLELIRETNRYMEESNICSAVLISIGKYLTSVLRTFGLVQDCNDIGFPLETDASVGLNKEQMLSPFLDVLTSFRESVRIAAISGNMKAVLSAADNLRDNILPDLGVRMEDKGSGNEVVTVWKLDDPEVLKKEKLLKEEAKRAKELAKLEQQKKEAEKEERSKIPPNQMFLAETNLYSAFDELGMPTKDSSGEPLSKGTLKKLSKEYSKQKELYEKYISKLQSISISDKN